LIAICVENELLFTIDDGATMIDPKHITNQNLFDLDYASSERKHCLKKLQAVPRFLLTIEEICAVASLGMRCIWLILAKRITKAIPKAPVSSKEAE
jgi:hypothetical protein